MINVSTDDPKLDPPVDQTFTGSFDYARGRVDKVLDNWTLEFTATEYRRRVKDIQVNVEDLRLKGLLKADETLIPQRIVRTNIQREKPPYIAFMTQTERRAIFQPKKNLSLDVKYLEAEFTRVTNYLGWELPHFRCLDGAQTHAWDAVEIEFDPASESKFYVEHCGHENVVFPLDTQNIEDCEFIVVIKQVKISNLRSFVQRFGFDPEQTEKVVQETNNYQNSSNTSVPPVDNLDSNRQIYKIYVKIQGVVHIGWYGGKATDNWLKPLEPLNLGVKKKVIEMQTVMQPQMDVDPLTGAMIEIQVPTQVPKEVWKDVQETEWPLVFLAYDINENKKFCELKGRVYLDEHKQEAATGLMSAFVNAAQRSSNLHACPEQGDGTSSPKQTDSIVGNGLVWNEPMRFFNTPAPDGSMLKGVEALATQNSQEALQVNYTVKNREDSRKTAEEVKTANRDQELINGVQVTLFSIYLRKVYTKIWRIIKSQAIQKKIDFCQTEVGINPLDGAPLTENNPILIEAEYELLAAGDVEVVQRQQKIAEMKEFWPIVSTTPIAGMFLSDLLRLVFPKDGERYAQALAEAQAQAQAIQQQMLARGTPPAQAPAQA